MQIVVFSAKRTISKATNKMFAKEIFFYKVLELLNYTLYNTDESGLYYRSAQITLL